LTAGLLTFVAQKLDEPVKGLYVLRDYPVRIPFLVQLLTVFVPRGSKALQYGLRDSESFS